MKFDKSMLTLYAVTDRAYLRGRRLEDRVEEAIRGGATLIQLREKDLPDGEFLQAARAVQQVTRRYRVPLIINDNLKVMLAADADGIHVGQGDQDAAEVRRAIGPDKILGVSAKTVAMAEKAKADGADYLGVGAVFPTGSKADARVIGTAPLRRIKDAVGLPMVAIGGVNEHNIQQLEGTGVDGIAVISALFGAEDVTRQAELLYALARRLGDRA